MSIVNGVYTPLTFDEALSEVISSAPASLVFYPGNPPELMLANMFAQADVLIDQNNGEIMALMMSPVGAMIDMMNPNNPRKPAISAEGYIVATNATGADITIPANSLVTGSTGHTYITGTAAQVVTHGGTLDVLITATEKGIGGNISAASTFVITGLTALTCINPLPILSGSDAESDAIYLNRITVEKTEYGTQSGSVAVETELKTYYPDAKIYVNNTQAALTVPVPVPGNGYNLIVRTPSGTMAQSAEIHQVFKSLSMRLGFVNSQSVGNALHTVKGGTIYETGVPQNYYFTAAQAVKTTIAIEINIRVAQNADRTELVTQANEFAVYFINRVMSLLSGINGNTDVTYHDGVGADVITSMPIAGTKGLTSTIAPAFGVSTIQGLVNDLSTMGATPQVLFDSTGSMTITIDPEVMGETPVVLTIGGSPHFIDFENDALFSDSSSWYDRYVFIDPADISITMAVVGWI